ncbi:hypothetical protein JAAARDRAFT_419883 [Jaapia argillacea MUCL 33604]|uniref:Uncharacterized protein n=1 Tax=Jaapia argillacea MUCL 33604 TaxID=933084 RepID=A0A067PRQ1_9AGAM|nr:hypothetical protein JAAARDRAFT_419883 [Jaapia argillacea MUCL 33604]
MHQPKFMDFVDSRHTVYHPSETDCSIPAATTKSRQSNTSRRSAGTATISTRTIPCSSRRTHTLPKPITHPTQPVQTHRIHINHQSKQHQKTSSRCHHLHLHLPSYQTQNSTRSRGRSAWC